MIWDIFLYLGWSVVIWDILSLCRSQTVQSLVYERICFNLLLIVAYIIAHRFRSSLDFWKVCRLIYRHWSIWNAILFKYLRFILQLFLCKSRNQTLCLSEPLAVVFGSHVTYESLVISSLLNYCFTCYMFYCNAQSVLHRKYKSF